MLLVITASCGGDSPSPPESGNPGGPVQIRGGERLGWSQQAASVQDLRSHSYRLYVDGSGNSLSGVQCNETAAGGGYSCSGSLPSMSIGQHVLELTSTWNGVESARSAALTVNRVASSQPGQTLSSGTASGIAAETRRIGSCARDAAACSDIHLVTADIGVVSAMSAVPDGRLLLVEDQRRIRVIENQRLMEEPALALENPSERIVGLAVDSAFENTRTVFVALTETDDRGVWELRITRYRELRNTLGEGATIFGGLTQVAPGPVPLAVDGEGLLYVAVPDRASTQATDTGGYASILRLSRDGLVPRSNLRASPVFARGYTRPTAIAVDQAHRRVWLAGHHPEWDHSLSSIPIDIDRSAPWPLNPHGSLAKQPAQVALTVLSSTPGDNGSLMVGAAGQVRKGTFREDGNLQRFETVAELEIPRPVFATPLDMTQTRYVAGATTSGTSVVLRLSSESDRR